MSEKKPFTRSKRRKTRVLGDKTTDKLINAPEKLRDRIIISILINTGMRRSDVVELTLRDVDLTEEAIIVPRQRKTGKTAYLTIPKSLVSDLKIYINENLKKKEIWLFPSRKGKDPHISVRTVSHIFTVVCEKAGLTNVTPHDLRATFLTNAGRENIPPKIIEDAIGISYETVMRYYQKFTLEDSREQFSKIQKG